MRRLFTLPAVPDSPVMKEAFDAVRGIGEDPALFAWARKIIEAREAWNNWRRKFPTRN